MEACGLMVIILGHGTPCSNPGWCCLHFTFARILWGKTWIHLCFTLLPAMGKYLGKLGSLKLVRHLGDGKLCLKIDLVSHPVHEWRGWINTYFSILYLNIYTWLVLHVWTGKLLTLTYQISSLYPIPNIQTSLPTQLWPVQNFSCVSDEKLDNLIKT